jgi:phosphate uptake regulator
LGFVESKDGRLIAGPYGEAERKVSSVALSPSPLLEREIEERYLLGFDVIQIESSEVINSAVRDSVKAAVKRLVGLEIVEEDSHRIVLQCLVEPSMLVPERMVRRLHAITLAMQKDALSAILHEDAKLANSVIERDDEVDRMYFLLVRLLRAAIIDISVSERLGTPPIDCLDYRFLAGFMESFGDYSVIISESALGLAGKKVTGDVLARLGRIGETVQGMYKDAVIAVLARNLKLASSIAAPHDEARRLLRDAEKNLAALSRDVVEKTASVIMALNRMCELCIDIADLTVTR